MGGKSQTGSGEGGYRLYHKVVLLGVLISLVYSELTGFSAGLIVPGYLALSLHSPTRLLWTFVLALMSVALCRLLSRWLIVYGRRRFALLLLLSSIFSWGLECIPFHIPGGSVIGMLIPGLIARELDRQGPVVGSISIGLTTALLTLVMLALNYPVFGA